MSVKRIVLALLFATFAAVASASAQEVGDLSYLKTIAGSKEFIQRTSVLNFPAGQAAVEAAIQWQVRHGYLTDIDVQNIGPVVSVSGSSTTIAFRVPGGPDVIIILSNGPFLPTELPHRLMTVNVIRAISNGF
jgi:protein-disulfide isomerase